MFDKIEAEQHVEEENSVSDLEVVNKLAVISLNQVREKMRELMVLFESCIDFRKNQAHQEDWVE